MVNGHSVALPAELLEPPSEPIELLIGRTTAMAASKLAAEIEEWRVDKRQPATTQQATDAIAQLYELRRAVLATGELMDEFEVIARAEGFRALRRYCDNSDALIAHLIDGVIEILDKVVRTNTL